MGKRKQVVRIIWRKSGEECKGSVACEIEERFAFPILSKYPTPTRFGKRAGDKNVSDRREFYSPMIASKAPGIFSIRMAWARPVIVVIIEHEKMATRRIRSPKDIRTSLRIQSGAMTRMESDIVSATMSVLNDRIPSIERNKATYSLAG